MGDELIYHKHLPYCGKNVKRYQRCSCPVENPVEELDAVWVINPQGTETLFSGTEAQVVDFLEKNPKPYGSPRGIYIVATADILDESQFLDLAT